MKISIFCLFSFLYNISFSAINGGYFGIFVVVLSQYLDSKTHPKNNSYIPICIVV